jgi:hypothetical protein
VVAKTSSQWIDPRHEAPRNRLKFDDIVAFAEVEKFSNASQAILFE